MFKIRKVKISSASIKCYFIVLLFFFSFKLSAQTDSLNCLSFSASNDAPNGTNRYFTSGISFSYIHFKLEDSFLTPILFRLKYRSTIYYGVALTQNIFTPNVLRTTYNPADRPYSATLTVSAFCISNYRRAKLRLTSSAQIGVIGNYALGKQMQDQFNIGNTQGWSNQLSNAPVINYSAILEKGYVNNPQFELIQKSQAEIGTLYINAKGGLKIRVGKLTSYFKKHEDVKGDFQLYFDAESFIKLVAYDATLTGSYLVNNQYALKYENINNALFEGNLSVVFSHKHVRLNITQHFISPEYKNAYWNKWVNIRFGYAF